MPHQCVRCGKLFDNTGFDFSKGCTECQGKLFFFIKQEALDQMKNLNYKLTQKDKSQIETDVYELLGVEKDKDVPVVLDFETIRVTKPGKYEIDLINLFKDNPLVYKLEEGKYMIDLPQSFASELEKKKNK